MSMSVITSLTEMTSAVCQQNSSSIKQTPLLLYSLDQKQTKTLPMPIPMPMYLWGSSEENQNHARCFKQKGLNRGTWWRTWKGVRRPTGDGNPEISKSKKEIPALGLREGMWLPRPEYGASLGNYSHAEVFPVNVEIIEKTIQSEEESRGEISWSLPSSIPQPFSVSLWLNRSGSQGAREPGKCSFHSAMREVLQTGIFGISEDMDICIFAWANWPLS